MHLQRNISKAEIVDILEKVNNKDDFVNFVHHLISDFKTNTKDWVNTSLEDYLNGMASWVEDSNGLFSESEEDPLQDINWNLVATVLFTGSRYE